MVVEKNGHLTERFFDNHYIGEGFSGVGFEARSFLEKFVFYSRFFENARPEWDLKYFSKLVAIFFRAKGDGHFDSPRAVF